MKKSNAPTRFSRELFLQSCFRAGILTYNRHDRAPKPFKCVIEPRSESAERLIRSEALSAY